MIQAQTQSENINELLTALCKAQSKIECALKDKKNPFFKSSYADLNSVWEACREQLTLNGLSVIQSPHGSKDEIYLVTILGHTSGQWIKSYYPVIPVKQDPQSLGSAITYARRYSLSAMVGICADEDDDGEKAMGRHEKKPVTNVNITSSIDQNEIDEFIRTIPDTDKEITSKYLQRVSEVKKIRVVEIVRICKEDMEKFWTNLNSYKKNLSSSKVAAA